MYELDLLLYGHIQLLKGTLQISMISVSLILSVYRN